VIPRAGVFPEGLVYREDFVSADDERQLLELLETVEFPGHL
jgi:hypothetical protein